ncbi:Zn-ribbon domain-containing OB-fold protein [Mycolicibacterium parafortuitum]|uniref:Zn-ribbon domain-containing OB-fold protein n=1 Tax=Mycolicibacterium parafortuitum TaxID=39692 RepID=UPI003F496943
MTQTPISGIPPRILPEIDDTARQYWTAGADGQLRIAFCAACARHVHPPRPRCPDCAGILEFRVVSGDATLFTYTVAYQQFNPSVPTPFVIALVELAEQPGLRLVTNIVDCDPEALVCGMALRVRFEEQRRGDTTVFVPVFAPPLT